MDRTLPVITIAHRQSCPYCFAVLDPTDTDETRRTFVQCEQCEEVYHRACWERIEACVNRPDDRLPCGATEGRDVMLATTPKPLKGTTRQPLLFNGLKTRGAPLATSTAAAADKPAKAKPADAVATRTNKGAVWLSRPLATLLVVCFFMPWLNLACEFSSGSDEDAYDPVNGWELTESFGMDADFWGGVADDPGTVLNSSESLVSFVFFSTMLLLPLIPISGVLILLLGITKRRYSPRLYRWPALLGLLLIVSGVCSYAAIASLSDDDAVFLSVVETIVSLFLWGLWATIAALIGLVVISFFVRRRGRAVAADAR